VNPEKIGRFSWSVLVKSMLWKKKDIGYAGWGGKHKRKTGQINFLRAVKRSLYTQHRRLDQPPMMTTKRGGRKISVAEKRNQAEGGENSGPKRTRISPKAREEAKLICEGYARIMLMKSVSPGGKKGGPPMRKQLTAIFFNASLRMIKDL